MKSKRISFMLGLMNVGVTGFIIGAYPTKYYWWYACVILLTRQSKPPGKFVIPARYSIKAVVFCVARWIDFRKKKWQYFLCASHRF
jgi:hypothetical protein